MDALLHFSIPIKGLKNGVHFYDFKIDNEFFAQFEDSPIKEGQFDVQMTFDKRPDLIVLDFDFKGSLQTECDRCLKEMKLPLAGQRSLLIKYGDESQQEDADIIYISFEAAQVNVAKYIYEYICLSIPIIKNHEMADDSEGCDPEMLNYLQNDSESENENPIWDALKELKKD